MSTKYCWRKNTSNSIFFGGLIPAVVAVALLSTIGCGSADDASSSEAALNSRSQPESAKQLDAAANQPAAAGLETPSITPASPLIGTWWGAGAIDENATTQLFDTLTPPAQEELAAQAEKFLATEMAIEFKPDSTIEMAIEIQADDNQRQSGITVGRWNATAQPDRKFEVVTTEVAADGTESTTVKTWQLSADGNQLSLNVQMPGTVLENCGPTIILDRQSPQSDSSQGRNMASDQNDSTTLR